MPGVSSCPLPSGALLNRYEDGHYTDCFFSDVPGAVSHQQFVEMFYTTWLFRAERFILKWLVSRPSTDAQARQLALGELNSFAAWTVEDRANDQLLMNDFRDKTRSWLMVAPLRGDGASQTRLYFGSAVISTEEKKDGTLEMGRSFNVLLGLHKLYSRALLKTAGNRLRKLK
jgi:hypothetical protein